MTYHALTNAISTPVDAEAAAARYSRPDVRAEAEADYYAELDELFESGDPIDGLDTDDRALDARREDAR